MPVSDHRCPRSEVFLTAALLLVLLLGGCGTRLPHEEEVVLRSFLEQAGAEQPDATAPICAVTVAPPAGLMAHFRLEEALVRRGVEALAAKELADSFAEANTRPRTLPTSLSNDQVRLLPQADFRDRIAHWALRMDLEPCTERGHLISRPGFDLERSIALIYIGKDWGGSYWLLRRTSDGWVLQKRYR